MGARKAIFVAVSSGNPRGPERQFSLVYVAAFLSALLLVQIPSVHARCSKDEHCRGEQVCWVKAHSSEGQCATALPGENLIYSNRSAPPVPLAERKPGDVCAFSVDCLPGMACYFRGDFSALGICLPEEKSSDDP